MTSKQAKAHLSWDSHSYPLSEERSLLCAQKGIFSSLLLFSGHDVGEVSSDSALILFLVLLPCPCAACDQPHFDTHTSQATDLRCAQHGATRPSDAYPCSTDRECFQARTAPPLTRDMRSLGRSDSSARLPASYPHFEQNRSKVSLLQETIDGGLSFADRPFPIRRTEFCSLRPSASSTSPFSTYQISHTLSP